jgi:hypothetical protein
MWSYFVYNIKMIPGLRRDILYVDPSDPSSAKSVFQPENNAMDMWLKL